MTKANIYLAFFLITYIAILIIRAFNISNIYSLSSLSIISFVSLLLFFIHVKNKTKTDVSSFKLRSPGILQWLVFCLLIYNSYRFLLPGAFSIYWIYYLSMIFLYCLLIILTFTKWYHSDGR